jgi:long-chain acyl-CoA synthetase
MEERPWLKLYDPEVPVSIEYPDWTVHQLLEDAAAKYPDQPCTVLNGSEVTYAEMNSLANRFAAALRTHGVHDGDRVGICLPNIPQFVLAFYAVLKAGGIVVAINPSYKQRELAFHISDAGVEVLIGLDSAYAMLQSVRQETGLSTLVLTSIEDASTLKAVFAGSTPEQKEQALLPGDHWLIALIASHPKDARAISNVNSSSEAIFQYSGGTTGTPKAAIGLHRNLVANSIQFRRWLVGLTESHETTLMAIPMYHVYGMVVGMSVSVLLGAKMVLILDPRSLQEILHNIESHKVSFFPGVPAMYANINRFPAVQAGMYQLSSIRACISGSAPLSQEVREQFESLTGSKLMEGYGLSEAPTATHCNPMFGEKRAGSIGLPLPDVDCRIVSLEDSRTILAVGEIGELILRGPQVMLGYHNMPDETAIALRDGWLYTGDIARMDADGYFYILDRKKELIKVSGFQVWPREIEEVIAQFPGVMEVSTAGVPDPIRGEVAKAWVVPQPGKVLRAEDIIAFCKEALVYYKVPTAVEFRETLPRTTVGKVLRRELVRQHLEEGNVAK